MRDHGTRKESKLATKKKQVSPPDKAKPDTPQISAQDRAGVALRPTLNAAAVIQAFGQSPFGELEFGALADQLRESLVSIENNDVSRCEAMLFSQANALQSIFTNLARRAVNQEYLKQYQCYMAIALKAQNQCRMTLETLSLIKNPPVFARQANIAHGPQQVNNGTPPPAPSPPRAENSQSEQNKLLEVTDGERLDTTTAGAAGTGDSAMATVETLDRPAQR